MSGASSASAGLRRDIDSLPKISTAAHTKTASFFSPDAVTGGELIASLMNWFSFAPPLLESKTRSPGSPPCNGPPTSIWNWLIASLEFHPGAQTWLSSSGGLRPVKPSIEKANGVSGSSDVCCATGSSPSWHRCLPLRGLLRAAGSIAAFRPENRWLIRGMD